MSAAEPSWLDRPGWHSVAACRPDPDWPDERLREWVASWHPTRGQATRHLQAICDACPALWECLSDAVGSPPREDVGFRGTSQRNRVALRRGRVVVVAEHLVAWDGETLDVLAVGDLLDAEAEVNARVQAASAAQMPARPREALRSVGTAARPPARPAAPDALPLTLVASAAP